MASSFTSEIYKLTGIMDVSQLLEPLIHKMRLSVIKGDHRQTPRHFVAALSTFFANMKPVYVDIIPEANNAKSGIFLQFIHLFFT